MDQATIARKLGESDQTITNWRTRGVPAGKHVSIARAFRVNPTWLSTGDGSKEEGIIARAMRPIDPDQGAYYLPIKRVLFKLSAGVSGFEIEPEDGESKPVYFRADWFREKGFRPDKLLAVKVSGDSMVPSLYDGDLVVVNTEDIRPRDGEVSAVNYEGELVIKRIRLDLGAVWLDSDNADQNRFRPRQCGEGCHIIGRVVYKQSERI